MSATKTCTRCCDSLPLSEFNRDRRAADLRQSRCRECQAEVARLALDDEDRQDRQRGYARRAMERVRLRRDERWAALIQKISTTPPRTEGPGLYPEPRPLASELAHGARVGLVPEGTVAEDLPAEFVEAIENGYARTAGRLRDRGVDLMPRQIAVESLSHDGLVEVAWWAVGLPARTKTTT